MSFEISVVYWRKREYTLQAADFLKRYVHAGQPRASHGTLGSKRPNAQDETFPYKQKRMGINVFDSGSISSLKEN